MKTIVITGASSGLGQATARELARRGHRAVLNARRADLIEALAGEIGEAALPFACDAADADADVVPIASAALLSPVSPSPAISPAPTTLCRYCNSAAIVSMWRCSRPPRASAG